MSKGGSGTYCRRSRWVNLTCRRIAEASDITMPFSTLVHENITIIDFTILDPTDEIYSAKVHLTEEKFMMVRLAVFFFIL